MTGAAEVRIDARVAPRITFASHQNAIPVLRDLVLRNSGETALADLRLTISAEPAFLRPREWPIDRLAHGAEVALSEIDVALDGDWLHGLGEAVRGEIVLSLHAGEHRLARAHHPVELLAHNEWGGNDAMPELIAAFVMPNDPAVERILRGASDVLVQAGLPGALNGYGDGDKARVWRMAAAIWSAVAALGLDYALPPASFERSGQKIRTPSQVLEHRRATCLDSAVLFAAALEAAGLNPLLVFTEGHAFAGLWLRDGGPETALIDEAANLRRHLGVEDLVLFETTLIARDNAAPFSAAIQNAESQLAEDKDPAFRHAIDIRRTRDLRIRPLPVPGQAPADVASADADLASAPIEAAPDFAAPVQIDLPKTPATRWQEWQRKLLDLSLRNRLLNFRPGAGSIPLVCPDPAALEDRLADGARFKIIAAPALGLDGDGRSEVLHRQRTGEDLFAAFAAEAMPRGEIVSNLDDDELDRRSVALFRKARNDLQEGGANTLYLALGFLVWRQSQPDRRDRRLRAPLILLPVGLERRSVRHGVRLTLSDDEPRFNTTLLQMLQQDFELALPGLDGALPRDHSGIDVPGIWRQVRHAIRDMAGFEVVEDVVLGTFSFAKYLMWKDLVDRHQQLLANPIVRHLIETPGEPYASDIAFPEPARLDDELAPADLLAPLPADSSQLAAVVASARGKDFVLIGPPGTGKSQTIANIISHNLAAGRTVLFVSEKTAALNVVYRRLQLLGLGQFCLELHSNKARKLDVLQQLRGAWEATAPDKSARWQAEADRLGGLRESLNALVEALHRRHRNGLSPFEAIGRVVDDADCPRIALGWPAQDAHDEAELAALRQAARDLDRHDGDLLALHGRGFAAIRRADWAIAWQRDLLAAGEALGRAARAMQDALGALQAALGVAPAAAGARQLAAWAALADTLPQAHGRDLRLLARPDAAAVLDAAEQGLAALESYRERERALSRGYRAEPFRALDLAALQATWTAAGETWWPRSWLLRRRVRNSLIEQGGAEPKPDPGRDLPILAAMAERAALIDGANATADGLATWHGFATDLAGASADLALARALLAAVAELAGDADDFAALKAALDNALDSANALLAAEAAIGAASATLTAARAECAAATAAFAALAGGDPAETLGADERADWPAALAEAMAGIARQPGMLRAWCAWRRDRDAAAEADLAPIVEALESGALAPGQADRACQTNHARWWIEAVVDGDAVLRAFVPSSHEARIDEFRGLDDALAELARDIVRARLAAGRPAIDEVTRGSEYGILRRELEKKRRHKPLRQLVTEMPNALAELTPCLLMSPLSVAQYLPPGQAPFDLVIFDEASQIPVWDAVGAIARGRQAVVVGDPKQLPPTNFFNRAEPDDDEAPEVEPDLESILDECLAASIPYRHLSWHYRSQHESLIAFSNHHYYEGGLVTFPSPLTEDRAVRLVPVAQGVYAKGAGRTNRQEAEAVVAEVIARLNDAAFTGGPDGPRSIGIVTFNAEQQRLIEDLLDQARRDDPALERFFDDDAVDEPVFVKNLESVQGDERDLILFSITYGPDAGGRVSMNFGPLNRDGGGRRLNVAVTRARQELLVFATLRADQIDLSRSRAAGVRDLKHFLEFAGRGAAALGAGERGSVGGSESPFERAVARALRSRGWRAEPQIGVSAFRIDLGIVDPDAPGRYLAGIECDGATYHRAATARDRDKIREQVLRNLGWTILRIWSTDWWIDPKGALERIDAALRAILAARQTPTPDDAPDSAEPSAAAAAAAPPAAAADVYRIADPAEAVARLQPDAFHDRAYDDALRAMIVHVIAAEGPISERLLATRIARAHGFQRTGARILARIGALARDGMTASREDEATVFWPDGMTPDGWTAFRPPADESARRAPDDIAMPELTALARAVAAEPAERRLAAMIRRLGFKSLRGANRARLQAALDSLEAPASVQQVGQAIDQQ